MYRENHTNHSDVTGAPVVQTMRQFNEQQYWPAMRALPPVPTRPKTFPVMDYFMQGDSDLDGALDAVDALSQLGLHGLMGFQFSQPEIARKLRANGHGIISGSSFVLGAGGTEEGNGRACANDVNSSCAFHLWDRKNATDSDLINATQIRKWAEATAAPFLEAGYTDAGQVSMLAQADEPSWSWDASIPPVRTSPRAQAMWQEYLEGQNLAPSDLGHATWGTVVPIGRYEAGSGRGIASVNASTACPIELRRLYYWSARFSSYSSADYMRKTTLALEEAFGQKGLGVYANYFNFGGQPFEPSASQGNNDSAAMSFDWFEAAKLRAGTTMWTEDWFIDGDAAAYHWSFLAGKLRSAVQDSPFADELTFAGYTVSHKSGQLEGGLLQKMLAQVGGGAKALRSYMFGPEYGFPNNCYSDNQNFSRIVAEIALVSGVVGAVEDVLLPGKRPRARVAIVAARSASYWDAWEGGAGPTLAGVTSSLVAQSAAYNSEVFALWKMLTLEFNLPVDFLSEDSLANASTLSHYGSVFITEPNLPRESLTGALDWVKSGANRTLLLSPFAGQADQYNQQSMQLLAETGVSHPLTASNYYGQRWIVASEGACYNPPNSWWCAVQNGTTEDMQTTFTAWGVWGKLTIATGRASTSTQKSTVVASFADVSPADHSLSHFSFYDFNASAQHGWTTNGCECDTATAVQAKRDYNMSSLWGELPWDSLINFFPIGHPTLDLLALRALANGLRPLLANGTISGVFIGDEVSCGNGASHVPFAMLLNITAELRAALPRPATLYMNDCVDTWPYIPAELDLVGMDRYTLSSNGMDEVAGAKSYYTSEIFPKLAPHQHAMVVPGLVGCSENSSYGRSVPKEQQEQALLQKLEGYYTWAKTEPRIAGINSWHFDHYLSNPDGKVANPSCDWLYGASDFPVLLARLKEIGQDIMQAGGGGGRPASEPDVAIVSTAVGLGNVVQFGFWPGLSWFYSDISTQQGHPPKAPWAPAGPLGQLVLGLMATADRSGPVTTNVTMMETPLLLTPDHSAAIITFLDWRRTAMKTACASPCKLAVEYVAVTADLPFKSVSSVEVVANGILVALPYTMGSTVALPGVQVRVKFIVPVQYGAMVQLKGVGTNGQNE